MKSRPIKLILTLLSASGTALTFFQMLPEGRLSAKAIILLAVCFLLGTLAAFLILTFIVPKLELSTGTLRLTTLSAAGLAIVLIFLFHLSFPQKELVLPRSQISIQVDGPLRFRSLNNGYRGIPLSDFTQSEGWERSGDELILSAGLSSQTLTYSGQHAGTSSLFFMPGKETAQIQINWGDGSTDQLTLDPGKDQDEQLQISHEWQGTAFWEALNFAINLWSVFVLLFWLLSIYILLLVSLLKRRTPRFRAVFLILSACTLFMRVYNSYNFPLGYDEGTYARAGMRYAEKILDLKWNEIPDIIYNHEHPAFVKMMNSLPCLIEGRMYFDRFNLNQHNQNDLKAEDYAIFTGRLISAMFSLFTVQSLAYLIHPLAGFFLMIHSYGEAYGAQTRLEAIPMLTSFLSIWFFSQYLTLQKKRKRDQALRCLCLAALTLGITAASKFIYCVIVCPMILMALGSLVRKEISFRNLAVQMLLMACLSLLFFYIFNPSVWKHPIQRISMEFAFHENYESDHKAIYPWWYSIVWVTRSIAHQSGKYLEKSPLGRAPQHFFFSCDELILLSGLIGAAECFRKRRIYIYWFLFALAFLFLWGTKWEQYTCILVIPICIAASDGFHVAANWILHFDKELMPPSENNE